MLSAAVFAWHFKGKIFYPTGIRQNLGEITVLLSRNSGSCAGGIGSRFNCLHGLYKFSIKTCFMLLNFVGTAL